MPNTDEPSRPEEDGFLFAGEPSGQEGDGAPKEAWKIIVADDQGEIHDLTRMVLGDFSFQGRGLDLLSAFSGQEAKEMVRDNPDAAVILLDVVMETDDAGLEVVRYVREELKNDIIQIILRTGQAGLAPEREVIARYEINDYKSKLELTAQKLFTTMTASLRAYRLADALARLNSRLEEELTQRRKAQAELEKYRARLEEMVAERTKELAAANERLTAEIAERKQTEKGLEKAKLAAEAANRAKSEFLANMSHELRTPLHQIIGLTDLTLTSQLTEEQQEDLEAVKNAAHSLMGLLKDVLDMVEIETGRMGTEDTLFKLTDLLGSVKKKYEGQADEKGLSISVAIEPGLPAVFEGDARHLDGVLAKLVDNAVKFTDQGSVVLSVDKGAAEEDSLALHFAVSDTGIGIEPGHVENLFEGFVQADGSMTRSKGGIGLGLTLAKQLVEMMDGRIWVESQPGQGSAFHFVVPVKPLDELQ